MKGLNTSTIARIAGLSPDGETMAALRVREKVIAMTEAAEAASIAPKDSGGLPHDLRAALASRTARMNGDHGLAEYYLGKVQDDAFFMHADPHFKGQDDQMTALLSFCDKVTSTPRDATETDIADLKSAGLTDPDIVRLCELIAFLAYQYRVIAGLSLMEKTA